MSSVSNSSDDSEPDEQQKPAQPEIQHQAPAAGSFQPGLPAASAGYFMPHCLPEGHAMAQMAYPFIDPYSGGVFAAYGGQPMIHPNLMGVHHPGVPLPTDAVEEPVYVNAKQYHGILRRRQSRAKAESENKLIKSRKPYLHESRHLHALKRARGCGGRFLNKKSEENRPSKSEENQQNPDSESDGNKQTHTSKSEENQQNLTSTSEGNEPIGAISHDKAQPSAGPASESLCSGNKHDTLLSDDTTHAVKARHPDISPLDGESS